MFIVIQSAHQIIKVDVFLFVIEYPVIEILDSISEAVAEFVD